jgi:hypothetical protein
MAKLNELRKHGAVRAGQWAAEWASADGQGFMWMGIGDTEAEAIADAEREIADQGLARADGDSLDVEIIEDDQEHELTVSVGVSVITASCSCGWTESRPYAYRPEAWGKLESAWERHGGSASEWTRCVEVSNA